MKKFFTILVLFMLIFCSAFLFINNFSIIANARQKDEKNLSVEKLNNNHDICSMEERALRVSLENENTHFLPNENIVVSYLVYSDEAIKDFEYTQNGYTIISAKVDKENQKRIILELSCLPNAFEHSLRLSISMSDGKEAVARLYSFNNKYGSFISPFSKDDAMRKFLDYAKNEKIITQYEYESKIAEMSRIGVLEEEKIEMPLNDKQINSTFTTSSTKTYVKGRLQWTDDAGNNHPLRQVIIYICDKEPIGSTHLATTYSDKNGEFSYMFDSADGYLDFENGGNDIFIKVYAGSYNNMVKNSNGDEYYYESSVTNNVVSGTTLTKNMTINMATNLGQAFQISQAILTARNFAYEMMDVLPDDISVRYPYDSNCYYRKSAKQITITGNYYTSTYPKPYASWDTIMHEYGHHIQHQLEIINSPGGSHSSDKNDSDCLNNKDGGVRLAWGESWPTVFGLMAQKYYSTDLSNIATVGDTNYTSYNKINYDIETTNIRLGEACERSIMAVLWDLYDSANDPNDKISLGYKNFWRVTTDNKSKTFSEFITYFYSIYSYHIKNLGENLSYYGMASSKPSVSNSQSVTQTVPPTFTWEAQGGSTKFLNNDFLLIFYDSMGTEILKTEPTNLTTYTLTSSEWNSILYSYGQVYYVAVSAMQTDSPITGEYISARSDPYRKPIPENLSQNMYFAAYNRYREHIATLQPGQYIDYKITFKNNTNILFQTFGNKDAKMLLYDSENNLLLQDDDSGYDRNALLNYTVNANETYILRVLFFNSSEFGKVKVGITPASPVSSTYEQITNKSAQSCTYNFSTTLGTTKVMTFTPTQTGTYKFATNYTGNTELDTYLYVIDPNSTDRCIYNNDNGSDLRATITTQLTAGRPYFIIVSTYDILATSGPLSLNVTKIN